MTWSAQLTLRSARLLLAASFAIGCTSASVVQAPDGGSSDADVHLAVDVTQARTSGRILSAGRNFSGAIWFPLESQPAIAAHLLAPAHKLGAIRYSLQRLVNKLGVNRADFAAGLPAALQAMPELDMLASYQQGGGEVLFNFMGTPSWLGNPAIPPPSGCDASQVYWRPPVDLDVYAKEVVAPIARFLTKRFGPGQHYEFWNEPTSCTWWGTTAQLLDLYAAMVSGIRMADPTAVIGGPSHAIEVEFAGTMADTDHDPTPLVKRFLQFAATYPGGRLPVDFVSLHSYQVSPASNAHYHEDQVATVRRWLGESGYPVTTRVINTEWFYEPYVDLAKINVDNSHVGVAYVGSTMLAFDQASYDNQSMQTLQDLGDPGLEVCSPVFAGIRGVPRSGYFVLELLSQLSGKQVSAASDNPWVRVAAFDGPGYTNVFAASFTPTEEMSLSAAVSYLRTADPALVGLLTPVAAQLKAYLRGSDLVVPAAVSVVLSSEQRNIVAAAKAQFDHERAMRKAWGVGPLRDDALALPAKQLDWRLELNGISATPSRVLHTRIDSQHVVDQAKVISIYKELFTSSVPLACTAKDQVLADIGAKPPCPALDAFCQTGGTSTTGLGVDAACTLLETFVVEISTTATMTHTQTLLEQNSAPAPLQQAFRTRFASAFSQYRVAYDKLYERADVKPFEEDISSLVRVENHALVLHVPAEPFSIHLFRIEH